MFLLLRLSQGRTDGQCQHRWQKVLNPELVKGPWTKEEDQKVRGAGSFLFWDCEGLTGSVSDREDRQSTTQTQMPQLASAVFLPGDSHSTTLHKRRLPSR